MDCDANDDFGFHILGDHVLSSFDCDHFVWAYAVGASIFYALMLETAHYVYFNVDSYSIDSYFPIFFSKFRDLQQFM